MIIDTHSHLYDEQFDIDREECINRCIENKIEKVVLVGIDNITNKKSYLLSQEYDIFTYTFGMHPSIASKDNKKNLESLENDIIMYKPVAIGECGLDYYWVKDNKEEQKELFIGQIELAIKYDLPIIIHMRDASSDTFEILKQYSGKIRGILHCYSGSLEMAKEFVKLGFYISLAGPVTYKNSKESKEVAKNIPIDKLLIETDCPYLTPQIYRGKRNESSYVLYVCEQIALLRDMSYEDIANITTSNAKKIFGLR